MNQLEWILLAVAGAVFAALWLSMRTPGRRSVRGNLRKAVGRSEKGRVLPRSNGKGSKHGNRRLWKGHTRKPRPAPPSPNGGKK